jgi:hypothetical protein
METTANAQAAGAALGGGLQSPYAAALAAEDAATGN